MKKLAFAFLLPLFLSLQLVNSAPVETPDVVQLLIPKLNSDRIAYFFGSYGVEPIQVATSPFGECRIANLHSIHDGEKIMRTLAIVNFTQPVHESLEKVHNSIVQGKSVGIAIRENGWTIDKLPVYFGSVPLSQELKSWMHENDSNQAAVHIYKLNVFKDNPSEKLHYCTIIEVHSPQYLDEHWLQSLYSDQYLDNQEISSEAAPLLDSLNSLIVDFPPLL